jgi:hypothetical protein
LVKILAPYTRVIAPDAGAAAAEPSPVEHLTPEAALASSLDTAADGAPTGHTVAAKRAPIRIRRQDA